VLLLKILILQSLWCRRLGWCFSPFFPDNFQWLPLEIGKRKRVQWEQVFLSPFFMAQSSPLSVDDIIQKWFPILGVIFIVSGLSYLFYDGFWSHLDETGRLVIGFLLGAGAITGGFTIPNRLKYFADAIIGGGVLVLYVSLIYGSRFDSSEKALIPEFLTLIIAIFFAVGVAYFSYLRSSKVILSLGILGGYLTPFFMGQAGTFDYSLGFSTYLIYFIAVNGIILAVVQKFFLPGIGLLNILGLLVGTTALSWVSGQGFDQNLAFSSLFLIITLGLHVAITALNAQKYENENDPFLFAGYIIPLLWYGGIIHGDLRNSITEIQHALYFIISAGIYFGAWYFVKFSTLSSKHYGLYFGGIISLILALLSVSEMLQSYSGLVFSLVSFVFAGLYLQNNLPQRQISFLGFGVTGIILTLQNTHEASFPVGSFFFYDLKSFFLILSLLPFLASYFFSSKNEEESDIEALQYATRIIAIISIGIITATNILQHAEVPKDFLFLTVPAFILAFLSFVKKDARKQEIYLQWAFWLGLFGFLRTFFIMLGRIYPVPSGIYALHTEAALIGITSVLIFGMVMHTARKLQSDKTPGGEDPSGLIFMTIFSFYTALFLTVTHELMLAFNYIDIEGVESQADGLRALVVTLWWASLASFMIFFGGRNHAVLSEKNLGFTLLLFTILKILIYDLGNVDRNLKVILFILVGLLILGISYFSHTRKNAEIPFSEAEK